MSDFAIPMSDSALSSTNISHQEDTFVDYKVIPMMETTTPEPDQYSQFPLVMSFICVLILLFCLAIHFGRACQRKIMRKNIKLRFVAFTGFTNPNMSESNPDNVGAGPGHVATTV